MQLLNQYVESIIFASESPVTVIEIVDSLRKTFEWDITATNVHDSIDALIKKYQQDEFSFELTMIAGGYQFLTKKEYAPAIANHLTIKSNKRLSTAALETLSIIAYKQPVTKTEVEHIRGVNCDYTIQKLLEKELIGIAGRAGGPGNPLIYETSAQFMDYFGINSSKDLPKLKEVEAEKDNQIGNAPELEFTTPN